MFEKKYTLLHSQKRRVYEILRDAGLEPAEFSWTNEEIVERFVVSRLSHRGGQHYFQFSSYELNAWCVACPGVYRTMDYRYPKTWEEQEGVFRQWAACLKQELEAPDPWQDLAKFRMILNGEQSGEMVNEPISAIEAEQIGQGLVRLADRVVADLSLNGDQAPLVRAKMGYLADAARRERSRDWMYMLLGVWATTAVTLGLSDQQAGRVWEAIRGELGSFARLLPGLVPQQPSRRSILGIRSSQGARSDEVRKSS
jgi:hypothetical protein